MLSAPFLATTYAISEAGALPQFFRIPWKSRKFQHQMEHDGGGIQVKAARETVIHALKQMLRVGPMKIVLSVISDNGSELIDQTWLKPGNSKPASIPSLKAQV